jgi:hypothetical protein
LRWSFLLNYCVPQVIEKYGEFDTRPHNSQQDHKINISYPHTSLFNRRPKRLKQQAATRQAISERRESQYVKAEDTTNNEGTENTDSRMLINVDDVK